MRIEQAINRLNLSVTVDTAVITKAKFQQSEELRKKVEELGGPDVVEQDPEKAKMLEAHMEASDQILNANIVAARKSLKVVGEEVMKSNAVLSVIEKQQQEHMRETRKSIQMQEEEAKKLAELTTKMKEEHGSKLDEMTESFMKVQQQAELQKLQNEVLKRQVDELKSMLTDVKDCMTKFPMPPREPERLLIVNNGGLLDIRKEDSAQKIMDNACKEILDRWGLASAINIADIQTLECKGGYFLTDWDAFASQDSEKIMSCATNMCGFSCARRASPCAHVIASEDTICYAGVNQMPSSLQHKPEEAMKLAENDPALMKQLQTINTGGNIFTNCSGLDASPEEKEKLQNSLFAYMMSDTTFYCGCPIKCEGITVVSLCCFGVTAPKGWCDKDVRAVEDIAAKVGAALEKEAQAKKFQNAQQVMMMSMMAMQQQAMMGGAGMMPMMQMQMQQQGMPQMMMSQMMNMMQMPMQGMQGMQGMMPMQQMQMPAQ